jgi:hypothetical protein
MITIESSPEIRPLTNQELEQVDGWQPPDTCCEYLGRFLHVGWLILG